MQVGSSCTHSLALVISQVDLGKSAEEAKGAAGGEPALTMAEQLVEMNRTVQALMAKQAATEAKLKQAEERPPAEQKPAASDNMSKDDSRYSRWEYFKDGLSDKLTAEEEKLLHSEVVRFAHHRPPSPLCNIAPLIRRIRCSGGTMSCRFRTL
jgi:hypothetical protein